MDTKVRETQDGIRGPAAADFRVDRDRAGHWSIRPLTAEGAAFLRAYLRSHDSVATGSRLSVDARTVNRLVAEARSRHQRVEYGGPDAVYYF